VTVQAPQDPVAKAPPADPAPGADLPAEGTAPDAVTLEELFQDPTDMDACCFADCFDQFKACKQPCRVLSDPERQACLDECVAELDACTSHC